MIRFCPNCHTERSLGEMFCEGSIAGNPCSWDLSSETIHQSGWRPQLVVTQEALAHTTTEDVPAPTVALCENGHQMDAGDLMCHECGGLGHYAA